MAKVESAKRGAVLSAVISVAILNYTATAASNHCKIILVTFVDEELEEGEFRGEGRYLDGYTYELLQ